MAYDGWVMFGDTEIANLARTSQLAETYNVSAVWDTSTSTEWLSDLLGDPDYGDVSSAPWYDPTYTPSGEFFGLLPLRISGLDDSTAQRNSEENVSDGASPGLMRNGSQTLVFSAVLVASSDRGAEYGKSWLNRVLKGGQAPFTGGEDLTYFRYPGADSPKMHRRNVTLSRAVTVVRKTTSDCSALWMISFTMTDNDSYEYGERVSRLTNLGAAVSGASLGSGQLDLLESTCPVYDYSPLYDPLYPGLVPSPTAPDFLPAGWTVEAGDQFRRYWGRITPPDPSTLLYVPTFKVTSLVPARMIRMSVWGSNNPLDVQCNPLFSAMLTYSPGGLPIYIDGERKNSYGWDGSSPYVRRTDNLVYSKSGGPVPWSAFNDPTSLLVTLDVFFLDTTPVDNGTVTVDLSLTSKSD